jgi:hypothetical protein
MEDLVKLLKALFEEDFWQLREDGDNAVKEVIEEEGFPGLLRGLNAVFWFVHISLCVCVMYVCADLCRVCCVVLCCDQIQKG